MAAAAPASVLIVEARFYDHLNDLLLAGARTAIEEAGHSHETITVPGALEIPGAVAMARAVRAALDDAGVAVRAFTGGRGA